MQLRRHPDRSSSLLPGRLGSRAPPPESVPHSCGLREARAAASYSCPAGPGDANREAGGETGEETAASQVPAALPGTYIPFQHTPIGIRGFRTWSVFIETYSRFAVSRYCNREAGGKVEWKIRPVNISSSSRYVFSMFEMHFLSKDSRLGSAFKAKYSRFAGPGMSERETGGGSGLENPTSQVPAALQGSSIPFPNHSFLRGPKTWTVLVARHPSFVVLTTLTGKRGRYVCQDFQPANSPQLNQGMRFCIHNERVLSGARNLRLGKNPIGKLFLLCPMSHQGGRGNSGQPVTNSFRR